MVDPASGPQQQQQHQQQQPQHPPKLSITVVPLDPLDDPLDFGCESDAGGPLKPLSDYGVSHATQSIYDDLVDEVILGIVFDVHRGAKLGLTVLLEDGPLGDSHNDFDNDEATRSSMGGCGGEGVDGDLAVSDFLSAVPASNSKKPAECVCPNCQRNMAASRFAPHLEKCMGMGRNSSRLASRRIASSASRQVDLASDDDFDDDDWTAGGTGDRQDRALSGDGSGSMTKKRRHHHVHKKDKNSPRRKKHRNGETNSASQSALASVPGIGIDGTESQSSNSGNAAIETMTLAERRAILSTMCGVVSEHTGRMCTRSLRCPQHTDSQRKFVRQSMLDAPSDEGPALMTDKEKDMIDVDTWEEGDSLASLLTAQSHDVPTPGAEASPAESTSTTASSTSSSAKRSQTKGAKKGTGKKMRNET